MPKFCFVLSEANPLLLPVSPLPSTKKLRKDFNHHHQQQNQNCRRPLAGAGAL